MNIVKVLKTNKTLKSIYIRTNEIYRMNMTKISPILTSKYIYKRNFKKNLNLDNPQTYNEKLMWLKLFWKHPLKSICADKYKVRQYITEQGIKDCLNELYASYDSINEINWDQLPNTFAIKVNNTCGANIICDDKNKLSEKDTLNQIDKWMKDKYYLKHAEMQYKDIPPKIICEKYLNTENGFLPIDYKIYCFNGVPKVIMLCTERETGHAKYYLCDLNGNILPFNKAGKVAINNGINKIDLPKSSNEMYDICRILSSPFPFVRIDFYDYNNKAIFGEMTFTPGGCIDNNISEEGEKIMGEWISLPSVKI